MAHPQQTEFCNRVRLMFPQHFNNVVVLDIGAMDINGNNRIHFTNSKYIGIDIGAGMNVDIVCSGHIYDSELRELGLEKMFYPFAIEYGGANDIYFWGIKRT